MRRLGVAMLGALVVSCVVEEIPAPKGLGSFEVEIVSLDDFARRPGCTARPAPSASVTVEQCEAAIVGGQAWPAGCVEVPATGTLECPRPFPERASPVRIRFRATALDTKHEVLRSYNGQAQVDLRPGRIENAGSAGATMESIGPLGTKLIFANGVSGELDLDIYVAHGPTRIWVEDCGSPTEPGSFSTGVSDNIYFDNPRLDQLNLTDDNTTSPLVARADNVCAISGDPRFSLTDEDGESEYAGFSHGETVNAPPPAIGSFLEITGCDRDEFDATVGQCERGPLVVTGIGNDGFYVTDLNPLAKIRGFNSIFAFNFNYPEDLQVGDVLTRLAGSPTEFSGSTQLGNPVWTRTGIRAGADLLPRIVTSMPNPEWAYEPGLFTTIHANDYRDSLKSFGRNLDHPPGQVLERLEGSLVCMDNLAPGSYTRVCDVNNSGRVERSGCPANLPPLCSIGKQMTPAPPTCNDASMRDFCLPLTALEVAQCELRGYVPGNPSEYCCERICYNEPGCIEDSALVAFGQWTADVYGRYEASDATPTKIAVVSRNANPDFDPVAFASEQLSMPQEARLHLRVIGNLRHVLAARPVWVIVARDPSGIAIQELEGGCP